MGLLSRIRGRFQHSGTQADKLKLWFVRRWLHLLPYPELKEYSEREGIRLALDGFYKNMVENMVETMIKLYDSYGTDPATAGTNQADEPSEVME